MRRVRSNSRGIRRGGRSGRPAELRHVPSEQLGGTAAGRGPAKRERSSRLHGVGAAHHGGMQQLPRHQVDHRHTASTRTRNSARVATSVAGRAQISPWTEPTPDRAIRRKSASPAGRASAAGFSTVSAPALGSLHRNPDFAAGDPRRRDLELSGSRRDAAGHPKSDPINIQFSRPADLADQFGRASRSPLPRWESSLRQMEPPS